MFTTLRRLLLLWGWSTGLWPGFENWRGSMWHPFGKRISVLLDCQHVSLGNLYPSFATCVGYPIIHPTRHFFCSCWSLDATRFAFHWLLVSINLVMSCSWSFFRVSGTIIGTPRGYPFYSSLQEWLTGWHVSKYYLLACDYVVWPVSVWCLFRHANGLRFAIWSHLVAALWRTWNNCFNTSWEDQIGAA